MFKVTFLAAAFFAANLAYQPPQVAEACGIGPASGPKMSLKRSKHRSKILIVGRKDSTLIARLRTTGHKVDFAASVGAAKQSKYQLVIVSDTLDVAAAQERYSGIAVVKKTSSLKKTVRKVENTLTRRAVHSSANHEGPARTSRNKTITNRGVEAGNATKGDKKLTGSGVDKSGATRLPPPPKKHVIDMPLIGKKAPVTADADKAPTKHKDSKRKIQVALVAPTDKPSSDRVGWVRQFQFGTNGTNLSARASKRLRANARWLQQHQSVNIVIEGHTDSVGSEAYNRDLSERRANVARDFLVGLGIESSRITVEAKGELEPATTPSASGKNRRIVLIKK